MTQITVSYSEKRATKNPDGTAAYGTQEFLCSIQFESGISADAELELGSRIQKAQAFVRERVLRESEPPSKEMLKLLGFLQKATDLEKLEKLSAFVSKKFNDGAIPAREAAILDEHIHDAEALIAYEISKRPVAPVEAEPIKEKPSKLQKSLIPDSEDF